MITLYAIEPGLHGEHHIRCTVPLRETAAFYYLDQSTGAFGFQRRVEKDRYATSPREAWERFRSSAAAAKSALEKRLAENEAKIKAANDAIAALEECQ